MERPTYPQCCLSLYCGETTCPAGCSNLPALIEYHRAKAAWLQQRRDHDTTRPAPGRFTP